MRKHALFLLVHFVIGGLETRITRTVVHLFLNMRTNTISLFTRGVWIRNEQSCVRHVFVCMGFFLGFWFFQVFLYENRCVCLIFKCFWFIEFGFHIKNFGEKNIGQNFFAEKNIGQKFFLQKKIINWLFYIIFRLI